MLALLLGIVLADPQANAKTAISILQDAANYLRQHNKGSFEVQEAFTTQTCDFVGLNSEAASVNFDTLDTCFSSMPLNKDPHNNCQPQSLFDTYCHGPCPGIIASFVNLLTKYQCVLADVAGCATDGSCKSTQACVSGSCENRCTSTADCNTCDGETCVANTQNTLACTKNSNKTDPSWNTLVYFVGSVMCSKNEDNRYCLNMTGLDTPTCATLNDTLKCCAGVVYGATVTCGSGNPTDLETFATACPSPYWNQTCGIGSASTCCGASLCLPASSAFSVIPSFFAVLFFIMLLF